MSKTFLHGQKQEEYSEKENSIGEGTEPSNSVVSSGKWEQLVQTGAQSANVDNVRDRAGQLVRGQSSTQVFTIQKLLTLRIMKRPLQDFTRGAMRFVLGKFNSGYDDKVEMKQPVKTSKSSRNSQKL